MTEETIISAYNNEEAISFSYSKKYICDRHGNDKLIDQPGTFSGELGGYGYTIKTQDNFHALITEEEIVYKVYLEDILDK